MKYTMSKTDVINPGVKLYRITRIADGAVGGYIEKESNLAHEGDAWVFGNAWVSGNARVSGDAWVSGDARVRKTSRITTSQDLVVITGFTFDISITRANVAIGCMDMTLEEWLKYPGKKLRPGETKKIKAVLRAISADWK